MKYKEFPNNPRKITNQALLQLGESLAEYGSLDGFVVNRAAGKYKDCILSGNQKNKHVSLNDAEIEIVERYDEPTVAGTLAVGHVKYKGERFPYREVSWSERKCEIANLRANNYGGENDRDLLLKFDAEILELGGVDLVFEEAKLAFIEHSGSNDETNALNSEAQEDEYEPDEISTDIKSGDIFKISCNGVSHTLLCGDSTQESSFAKIASKPASIVFTDPDFSMPKEALLSCYELCKKYSSGNQFWVCGDKQAVILASNDFEQFAHFFVQDFRNATLVSNGMPMTRHCMVVKFGKQKMNNLKDGFITILEIPTARILKDHRMTPMAKRIALPFAFISHYTMPGEAVLDCFAHSGSTMMAAQQFGVDSLNIELEPKYCQFILNRFLESYPDAVLEKKTS